MQSFFERELTKIDHEITATPAAQIPWLFRYIPLELYGELLLSVPEQYSNIRTHLPTMPSLDVQREWCGASPAELMRQSIAFTRTVIGAYGALTAKNIGLARVLDFGCGWGRLMRVFAKYVPDDQLYGVDPNEVVLSLCHQHRVPGTFAKSDYIPRELPFDGRFDFVFAFSVFTHLSETTARAAVSTLRRYQPPGSLLAVTIRPVEYWRHREEVGLIDAQTAEGMREMHISRGFAFAPDARARVGTEITYGDISMSIEFARELFDGYRIQWVEWSAVDPLQIVLLMTTD